MIVKLHPIAVVFACLNACEWAFKTPQIKTKRIKRELSFQQHIIAAVAAAARESTPVLHPPTLSHTQLSNNQ